MPTHRNTVCLTIGLLFKYIQEGSNPKNKTFILFNEDGIIKLETDAWSIKLVWVYGKKHPLRDYAHEKTPTKMIKAWGFHSRQTGEPAKAENALHRYLNGEYEKWEENPDAYQSIVSHP